MNQNHPSPEPTTQDKEKEIFDQKVDENTSILHDCFVQMLQLVHLTNGAFVDSIGISEKTLRRQKEKLKGNFNTILRAFMEAFELLGHTFHLKNLTSMIFEALATHQYIAIILIPKKQLDDYPKKNHLLTPNDPTTH